MQLNQKSKQHFELSKSSLNNNFLAHESQTHTHTHTLDQIYISKTSQDSLVSIH